MPAATLPTATLPTATLPTATLPTATLPTATLPTATLVAARPRPVRTCSRAAEGALLERRTLRRLLDEATGLVAGVAPGHRDRATLIARHLEELMAMLVDHDAAVTRVGLRVARRDPVAAEQVARARCLRGDLGVQIARLRLALPYWERGASPVCRDTVWEVLLEIGAVVDVLFATEEHGILPFDIDGELPRRPLTEAWIGHVLETLTVEAGQAWRRERLTAAERARWALSGRPRFRRARRRLLG